MFQASCSGGYFYLGKDGLIPVTTENRDKIADDMEEVLREMIEETSPNSCPVNLYRKALNGIKGLGGAVNE